MINLDSLCVAVSNAINTFNTRVKNSNHEHIVNFQTEVWDYLNTNLTNYKWTMEKVHKTIHVDDKVDIYGESKVKGEADVVIEIDGWRADQVAKKFLSRAVLYSLDGQVSTKSSKPIDYIAILYPQRSSSLKESLKYIKYADIMLRRLNKKSTCSAIVFNPNGDILKYEPKYKLKFSVNKKTTVGLVATAVKCIYEYLKPNTTIDDLENKFGKFISRSPKSRAKKSKQKTSDNKDFYIYTQWRSFGPQSNWEEFVKLLPKKIVVKELYHFYKLGTINNVWDDLSNIQRYVSTSTPLAVCPMRGRRRRW